MLLDGYGNRPMILFDFLGSLELMCMCLARGLYSVYLRHADHFGRPRPPPSRLSLAFLLAVPSLLFPPSPIGYAAQVLF